MSSDCSNCSCICHPSLKQKTGLLALIVFSLIAVFGIFYLETVFKTIQLELNIFWMPIVLIGYILILGWIGKNTAKTCACYETGNTVFER
ncbi:MAG: hypothetical protein Q7S92_05180 [Candidatus Diapherotrites archaeon]|nr:hypothetical protein [Candidatus Diapherotrites archaeon]